jgi:hypothetical protein
MTTHHRNVYVSLTAKSISEAVYLTVDSSKVIKYISAVTG